MGKATESKSETGIALVCPKSEVQIFAVSSAAANAQEAMKTEINSRFIFVGRGSWRVEGGRLANAIDFISRAEWGRR